MLEKDLWRIRCDKLMEQPWCLKAKAKVAELLTAKTNKWDDTLR